MKSSANCLTILGFVNPPISQALAINAFKSLHGAGGVIKAQLGAVVGPEIELSQITLQVLLAAMLIGADHAALKDRKEAFQRVGVDAIADIFLAVIDRLMLALGRHDVFVDLGTVRMQG